MSAPIVINGKLGAYEQPQEFGCDSSGPYCVRTWHGTAAEIAAQHNANLAAGILSTVQAGYGVHICTARMATGSGGGGIGLETPVDNWEFFGSHVEKDILEADNATIEAISDDNKGVIRYRIENPGEDPPRYFVADGSQTTAEAVWKLMHSGMHAIRVNAPALRHTQTVSNQWTIKASLTNVGRILSTATLITTEAVPTSVLFNLPFNTSARTGLTYGWMKMHPTVRGGARQKMQIEQEWEYGLWPPLIYGAVL